MSVRIYSSSASLVFVLLFCCVSSAVAIEPPENPFLQVPTSEIIARWDSAKRLERLAMTDAMIENREKSLPVLRSTLSSGTQSQKLLACVLLSEMRDKESIKLLTSLAEGSDLRVSLNSLNALRDMGAREATPRIRQILLGKNLYIGTKVCCLLALGRLGTAAHVPDIKVFLHDPDPTVQIAAATALGMLQNADGKSVLITAARSKNPSLSGDAIEGLGSLDDPDSEKILEEVLQTPGSSWKTEAQISLAKLRLRKFPTETQRLDELKRLSGEKNRGLSRWAVNEIANTPPEKSLEVLKDLSQGNDDRAGESRRLLKVRGIQKK